MWRLFTCDFGGGAVENSSFTRALALRSISATTAFSFGDCALACLGAAASMLLNATANFCWW
jgi:hypothetical protein